MVEVVVVLVWANNGAAATSSASVAPNRIFLFIVVSKSDGLRACLIQLRYDIDSLDRDVLD